MKQTVTRIKAAQHVGNKHLKAMFRASRPALIRGLKYARQKYGIEK